ncbi:MAG: O-antigen ligase family protein [Desulfuromonadales bacterium]|nr:O-antigen ligase family protein [Desulfuromonadales bacterium]
MDQLVSKILNNCNAKSSNKLMDSLFHGLILFSIFIFTAILLNSKEGAGSGTLVGFGKIVFFIDSLLLFYILNNLKYLKKIPLMVFCVLLWLAYSPISSFNYIYDIKLFMASVSFSVLWCLMFLYSYIYSTKNRLSLESTKCFFSILFIFNSFIFFKIFFYRNESISIYATINEVYYVLLIVPWLFLIKQSFWRYLALFIATVVVFCSMKRTALVVLVLSYLSFFAIETYLSYGFSKVKRIFVSIFLICIFMVSFAFVAQQTGDYFASRLSTMLSDRGSGRLGIYQQVYELQQNADLIHSVFGHGFNDVSRNLWSEKYQVSLSAHNDFQEVLYDFGYLGLLFYLIFHFSILVKSLSFIKTKKTYASAFFISYLIFLFLSFLSHLIIYPTYFIYLSFFWGSVLGINNRDNINMSYG